MIERPSVSDIAGRFRRNPIRYIGLVVVLVFCFVAVFADYLAPYEPSYHTEALMSPCLEHPFGTNNMGQDLFSQVIRGTTLSMEIGLMSALIAIGVGVTVGVLAGYYRGPLEQFLLSVTDAFIIIPGLPLVIVFVAYAGSSSAMIVLAISILAWCPMARVIHPRVMAIMNSPYVTASKMLGKSDFHILIHHIIPNCREVISAKFALAVGTGMLAEASLSFIGLGDRFSTSWGTIVNEAFRYGALILGYWWWYLIPGLLICLAVLAFMMISYSNTDSTGVVE